MTESIPYSCDLCGGITATAHVTFKQNVSYFFRRQEKEFSGRVCFGCMTAKFVKSESVTLLGTWWGIIGCLLGPVFILMNLLEYLSGSFLIGRDGIRRWIKSTPQSQLTRTAVPITEGGATPETAIRILAANSLEGIPKEYAILRAMFGTPNRDWKLISRSVIHGSQKLEKFVVSVSGKRKEVYFDITEWFAGNTSQYAKAALEDVIVLHEKQVAILLPKGEFMTLQTGLLNLTEAQLDQIGLSLADRKVMLDPFLDTTKQWFGKEYASAPEHVAVTALISVWSKIMGLLVSWQPADLLQEEELENLKAIIGGTMKRARENWP